MIKLNRVSKKFATGTFGLSDISLEIDKGEFVFLVGPTGSGKTTIFRLLNRESFPTSGNIIVNDWDLVKLPKNKTPSLRKKIGVVFQDLKLLLDRTILENILLPLEVSGVSPKEALRRAGAVLEEVGITDQKDKFPIQLSGGELQRAAIARALVLAPSIILADEPTGNLDSKTAFEIVKLLAYLNEKGATIIMATHNLEVVKNFQKRVIELDKGRLIRDDKGKQVEKTRKK